MNFESETRNTRWRHGPAFFEPPRFPAIYADAGGLVPVKGIINMEVGEEVLLYIRTTNRAVERLTKVKPFRMRVNYGVARNEFGPLGFFLFWIPYSISPTNAIAIYDLYVNLANESLMAMWMELAYQTHWHVFLLDQQDKQHGFWEFTNTFRLSTALRDMMDYCNGVPSVDFDKAKEKFITETTLEALHAMTSRSEVNENGVSIFDASNAVPSAPAYPNPLKNARFGGVINESLATHGTQNSEDPAHYERGKFLGLSKELRPKTLVYLDICHWINLLNVWLQSPKSMTVYEQIVNRLKFLCEESALICPVSAPIFEELMKQSDPLSRAATANLIESLSRGICVRSFKDTLCEQWKNYASGQAKFENELFSSITKIGFWAPEGLLKDQFWRQEMGSSWRKIIVDLRWNLTVDDYQRLVSLGKVEKEAPPPFLSKWRSHPAEQRSNKSKFLELLKICRSDVWEAFSDVISNSTSSGNLASEPIIGNTDYGRVPCMEIAAGMCAAKIYHGGRIRENDVLDFIHAAVGIPSCRAYFCDRPMEHLLRNQPLAIDSHFPIIVRSRPEDLLNYLESLEPMASAMKDSST